MSRRVILVAVFTVYANLCLPFQLSLAQASTIGCIRGGGRQLSTFLNADGHPETVNEVKGRVADTDTAKYLYGSTTLYVVFVKGDPGFPWVGGSGDWSAEQKNYILDITAGAGHWVVGAAYPSNLSFQVHSHPDVITVNSRVDDDISDSERVSWMNNAARQVGLAHGFADENANGNYTDDLNKWVQQVFATNNAVTLFFLDRKGRAYAWFPDPGQAGTGPIACLYFWDQAWMSGFPFQFRIVTHQVVAHEMLHLFGAEDEYGDPCDGGGSVIQYSIRGTCRYSDATCSVYPGDGSVCGQTYFSNQAVLALNSEATHSNENAWHFQSSEDCIMKDGDGYHTNGSFCTHTRGQVGLGDIDGDGILDPSDGPNPPPQPPPPPPPVPSQPLKVSQGVWFADQSRWFVGEELDYQFWVSNTGTSIIHVKWMGLAGRGPGGSDDIEDFPGVQDLEIEPGQTQWVHGSRKFWEAGEYHFWCSYQDQNGDWHIVPAMPGKSNSIVINLQADTQPPVTTLHLDPPSYNGCAGWYTTNVTASLTAVDDHSGVKDTWYRLNGGNWIEYSQPFIISDCRNIVEYWSEDNVGNEEEVKSSDVNVDTIPPTSSVALDPPTPNGCNDYYVTPVTFTVTSTDSCSGVQRKEYKIDNGPWLEYTAPVVIDYECEHDFYYRAEDNACNWEEPKSVHVKIDLYAPVITVNAPQPTTYTHADTITVDYNVTDSCSGVKWQEAWLQYEDSCDCNSAILKKQMQNGDKVEMFWLGLEPPPAWFWVDAEDFACWKSHKDVKFNVISTIDSMFYCTNKCREMNWITVDGIRNSLITKLTDAKANLALGNKKTVRNIMRAYIHEVEKGLTFQQINMKGYCHLVQDAQYVIDQLGQVDKNPK